eukprot:TRINITY_DN330_c0_g2_i1.p1 TRINITY_DN330_c0_g2~~TRINITY_DN330_c0_g2_i1.p1  ORF type:complete len:306 (-),score=50.60 TRINITY_DN330_c0_g2_i1:441-1358(-)
MHPAAVARVSKAVVHYGNAPHNTALAAAGSLIAQDESFSDLQVSEFLHDSVSSRSEIIDDIEYAIQDLITNPNVINFVRARPSFQSLQARLTDSTYEIEQLQRDVLSLSPGAASARLISELTTDDINEDISNHLSMHSHASGEKLFHETSREWLRERISKENMEQFFKRLDSSDVNSIDGIRLSFKRASNETPGLRSLLSLKTPLAATNTTNISDYPSPMSGRYIRRPSNGHVGSPPRERLRQETVVAPPPVPSSEASDPLAAMLIMIATAIVLAKSIHRGPIVEKLIQFTRRVTSWIASHWKRQ